MANCGHLYFALDAKSGTTGDKKPIPNATVLICEPNTCTTSPPGAGTPLGQAIFSDALGVNQITNPLITDSNGVVEFYALYSQSVDLFVTGYHLTDTIFRREIAPYGSTP